MEQKMERVGGKEFNPLDVVILILKRFRLIMSITMGVALLTAALSLTMPRIYEATTRVLSGGRESPTATLLSRISGAGSGFADLMMAGMGGTPDLFIAIMQGRTVLDAVIDRFHLVPPGPDPIREPARKRLLGAVKFDVDKKSGIVLIKVRNRDPQKAMDLANAFAEELSNRILGLAVTNAGKKRTFFEQQLHIAHVALADAEAAMSSFQESTGAVKFEEQSKAVLEGIARLQARVVAKEIELKVMKTYATTQNRDVRRVEEELKGLQEQLQKMEGGASVSDGIIPTDQMPALGAEYVRKLREFRYQEALYEILLKQYETARLAEAQDSALVQVVDTAAMPEIAVAPRRRAMVEGATAVSFIFAVLLAFSLEKIKEVDLSPENRERMEQIRSVFSRWRTQLFSPVLKVKKLFWSGR
jgi:uncharacterized protein involved in exopolysaccharide biosynthesis